MAWTDPDYLEFDMEQFRTFRQTLNDTKDELTTCSQKLLDSIEDLRNNGWNTPAGLAFFQKFDSGWVNQVTTYVSLLSNIEKLIETAQTNYQEVIDAADELKF